jgi:hypothetical protein
MTLAIFLWFFLTKLQQAMLSLKGYLFDTFVVVLTGHSPKHTKTFLSKVWVFPERPLCSNCIFLPFPH